MGAKGQVTSKLALIQKPLIERIRAGTPIKQACASVGLSRITFYDWMNKGEKAASGQYKEFYEAVERAKADAVVESIIIIRKAAKENWQAAAWYLERCHPEEFARNRMEINHTGGVEISLKLADCSKKEDECNITPATRSSSRRLPGPKE